MVIWRMAIDALFFEVTAVGVGSFIAAGETIGTIVFIIMNDFKIGSIYNFHN